MSIFKGQNVQFSLDVGVDLSSAGNMKIYYIKPTKVKGSWPGTAVGTAITYNATFSDLDQSGEWELQPYYEIGPAHYYGAVTKETILDNIT